jgi:DNA-binding CsgD family transcriptional regulator
VLAGREAETRVIGEVISVARRGQAGTLLLSGEPGMGKTTLLEWSNEVADDFIRLAVRGAPADATLGFAGLLQVVRPLSGHLESLSAGQAELLRGVCALGEPPQVVDRLGVHVAVLLLLATAAEQSPVLVGVDDVQWLDVESRDALLFAARRLDSDAVAMLFAVRAGETGHDNVVSAARLPILRLSGLDVAAAAEMLHDIRDLRPPSAVVSSLVDTTGGNPLALVEVARRLTTGQLSGTEPLPAELPLTAPASHAYADMLDRMAAPMLEALGLFALAEGDAAAAVLAAAADLGIASTAVVSLESLGLLRLDTGRVRLRHALLATAAVTRLTPVRRRQMHQAVAVALAVGTAGEPARRAWHLAEATQVPDEDVAAALAAVAADRQSTSSHAAALAFDRAARLTPDRPTRALRYQAAADAAAMAGYDEWSLRLLTYAREQVDDPVIRARLDHARGVRHIVAGRPRAAWTLLPESAAVLRPHDPRQSALVLADAALAAFLVGRLEDARATAARAQQLSPAAEVHLAGGIVEGLATLHLGDLAEGLQLMSAPARLPDLPDALGPVIEYLVPVAIGLTWSGRYETATSLADRVIGLLRAIGALGLLPAALYASAYVNVWQGRLRRAYLHASEAMALADEGGNRLWQFLATGCLALAETMRGNPAECQRLAASAQQRWADFDLWHPRDIEDALGLAALCAGDVPAAVRHLERANIPQRLSPPVFGRPTAVDLVEAYVRAGRGVPDIIARHIEAPVPEDFPAIAAAVWRCRGLIEAADTDEAFEAALARYADASLPWQEARTRLNYGERLRRSGRRVDARHQLRRAVGLFDDTGSPMWADRAATELAASGGEAQRGTAGQRDTLTPQELHVALAVATGATNREVSSSLFLSPKTIEMHLTHIYRKLGIRSRTDLAVRFAGGDVQDQFQPSPAATPALHDQGRRAP